MWRVSVATTCPTHTQAFPRHALHSRSQMATSRHSWGVGVGGVSPWPSNVASPRKTSRLCLPLRDELNEEEQSFEKGSRDTCSCSTRRRNCANPCLDTSPPCYSTSIRPVLPVPIHHSSLHILHRKNLACACFYKFTNIRLLFTSILSTRREE